MKTNNMVTFARLWLATLLILSCSTNEQAGGNPTGSNQSYDYCITADNTCLVGPFTANTCNGQPSNSCPYGISSPSIGGSSSSGNSNPGISYGTLSYQGQTYKTVKIGNQTWLAENLNYAVEGSKCYDNDPANCTACGRLYDWNTALAVCPSGWRLPTDADWTQLTDFVGGASTAGNKLREKDGTGTDNFGFSAKMCGNNGGGIFNNIGFRGDWWSASEVNSSIAYSRDIYTSSVLKIQEGKESLLSVRCVQGIASSNLSSSSINPSSSSINSGSGGVNSSSSAVQQTGKIEGSPITYQGKTYKTVVIGTQIWMAENLNYEVDGSKCYGEGISGVTADSVAKNCATYGRLYNWATAMGLADTYNSTRYSTTSSVKHKGICPAGWHIPTNAEWDELYHFADGTPNEGGKYYSKTAGKHLKAVGGWNSDGNGEDTYGFAALPGGNGYSDGSFYDAGSYGDWWSSSEYTAYNAYLRRMGYDSEYANWGSINKTDLHSVRCLQD